ncbi:MAG: hypothetical protein ACR2P6_01265 [Gammaproteobacteria bacterium]
MARSLIHYMSLIVSCAALGACITTRVEETKDAATGIEKGESIVILASSFHTGNETEDDFVNCVTKRVARGRKGVDVMADEDFRDALFPWLEPRLAPRDLSDLPELLQRPGINEAIADSGVRYVVWLKGDTDQTSSGGGLSCAAAPGAAGCFGLAWWEDQSAYEAIIWDLQDGVQSGTLSTDVSGTSVIPAIVIPLPLIARVQAAACKGLATQLRVFIAGDGPAA